MRDVELDDCPDDSHQASHQAKSYRRIELITGDTRRRRWTAEEKGRILAESFRPDASVAEVARRHGMSRGLLWAWRHQARKRGSVGEQCFVPVRVVEETTASVGPGPADREGGAKLVATEKSGAAKAEPVTGTIDIEIKGTRVRVNGVVDAGALRQVLSYLGDRT